MMKGSNQSDTPRGTSKICDLISSVNTLIDNLSEPVDDAASTVIDRSAAVINRQLEQLERLFATQPRAKRRSNYRSNNRQKSAVADDDGACSRSPCSNWTASNCNAEGGNSPRRSANRRCHSVSITSSESGYSGCCLINTGCFAGKPPGSAKQQQRLPVPPLPSPPLFAASDSLENSSNRKQLVLRRRPRAPLKTDAVIVERAMDFAYLKSGLVDDSGHEKGHSCADSVIKMERTVQRMQDQVAKLRRKCEQQLQGNLGECGLPERLKSEIRQVQTRVSSLHSLVRQTLGTRGAAAQQPRPLGCRHLGCATENSRDPLTDLKCKYERGLLYSRFDVNWPFLHIVATRPPSRSDPVCCNNE